MFNRAQRIYDCIRLAPNLQAFPALHIPDEDLALPFFNERASIIFNGSVNALTGIADSSLYTANKGAIHALARALAAELIGRRIRVDTITIGPTA